MNIKRVNMVMEKLAPKKPTLRHLKFSRDGKTVVHGEIHNDAGLLWIYPKGSRARVKKSDLMSFGGHWKSFSLENRHVDYEYSNMGRRGEV